MKQKAQISAEDITQALNEALRRRQQCATMSVERIFEASSGPANWDAAITVPEGGIDPECKRIMLAIKLGLQNRFDLASSS